MSGTFEPWGFRRGPEAIGCYDYHVFVSYTSPDLALARRVADGLVGEGLTVFFAPETFAVLKLDDLSATFWSQNLETAMLHSCHFVGLVTPRYVRRPWCHLELSGFRRIRDVNPSRTISLLASGIDDTAMPEDMKKDVVSSELDQFPSVLHGVLNKSPLVLGQQSDPKACFPPLPLVDLKRDAGWIPWGDGSRYDPDPPYEAYERCVRELMVLIRLGAQIESLPEHFSEMSRWQERHIQDAVRDARDLTQRGVAPF